jgi:3-dehydroquinate dehydratase/shikimate dehydrogenase
MMHRTLLCVPILVQDEPTALADAVRAQDLGADLVEFRIDELFSGALDAHGNLDAREVSAVLRLVAGSPVACIVTCRCAAEGGHYDGDDAARVALYERLGTAGLARALDAPATGGVSGEHPPRYIDVEHATYTRSANLRQKVDLAVDHPRQRRDVRTGLILSMHDFSGRPPDLLRRLSRMQLEDAASVVKIAVTARSVRDNLELLDLLAENAGGKPMIALAMGPFGLLSRALAPKFGAFLTFASLRKQSATAPGQPTVGELIDTYRFRSIGPTTRVFGVVGWPLEHSLSPAVHNAGFESLAPDTWDESEIAASLNAVYVPLPVPEGYEHFKASALALIDHPRLDFSGCSVTLPHKTSLVRLAGEQAGAGDGCVWSVDELSRACGAANTLVVRREGGRPVECLVSNTDAPAAVACIEETLGAVAGRRVAVLGTGGVARAVAAGLMRAGAGVLVISRERAKADGLAGEFSSLAALAGAGGRIAGAGMDEALAGGLDAVVNATPVGMMGGPEERGAPIDVERLAATSPGCVVMDTVYRPLKTPLLARAERAGLKTVDGLGMFVRQAGMQFAAFTGQPAPMGLFERVCREALKEL